jgi:cytosine/adenosine deaminase-related metal-dependent hydrolase
MCRLIVALLCLTAGASLAAQFDLVITGGRVMDPETGLDGIRHLGIRDGTIVALGTEPLDGEQVIDATGLVVAPGFIDLHAHGQDVRSNRFQAADGVTTALELEQGVLPVAAWLESRQGRSPINFGAASGHLAGRINQVTGLEVGNPVYVSNEQRAAAGDGDYAGAVFDAAEIARLVSALEAGLKEGGLGIGSGITYMPGASHEEILALFELAARYQVPVFTHIRQARYMGGDLLAPLQEVLADAAATGAPLHVVHINSSMDESARTAMRMIRGMRARGIDVTTESYPYTAGSTRLESALFDDYQGDYGDLQWTETGERLTKETFDEYRQRGGWVIIHGRSEDTNRWLVAQPDVMVASDGVPFVGDFSHPRSAGTFSRVLGHYVRDEQALPLMVALAKMTLDPARRLEDFAPAMRRKGRVQVGMDADLTLFDPEDILDQATYTVPARTSAGIVHVLVNGVGVVRNGELVDGAYPGRAIVSDLGGR